MQTPQDIIIRAKNLRIRLYYYSGGEHIHEVCKAKNLLLQLIKAIERVRDEPEKFSARLRELDRYNDYVVKVYKV